MWNALKTTLLLGVMTGFMMALGGYLGGQGGIMIGFLLAAVMNVGTWFMSDTLAVRSSGAVPVESVPGAPTWLVDDVAELAKRANMPMPKVYIVPHERSPNAFATGRSPSKGVVAVTAGLLQVLDRRQVRGVLAHELAHIKNRDTLTSTVAATMAGAIGMIAHYSLYFGGRSRDDGGNPFLGLAIAILSPMVATVIHMAISRTREYAADQSAAEITEDPQGLADALLRISQGGQAFPMSTGNEATHYIANNFAGNLGKLFSTHPPMEERVRRLQAMKVGA